MEFGKLIETDMMYKKYKYLKNYSLNDFKIILSKINDQDFKKSLEEFVEEFTEKPTWIDYYNELINEQKFKINRISSIRNRLLHSGFYDNRYYIFAEQLERILKQILEKLAQFHTTHNFKTFFKKTEYLLNIPF